MNPIINMAVVVPEITSGITFELFWGEIQLESVSDIRL